MKLRRQRYKVRLYQGRMVVPLELCPAILDLLVRHGIATPAQVDAACTPEGKMVLGQAIAAWFRRSTA